ncbi:hypothetical protein F5884DRAFT_708908 [Xylogone sp. PMI_703]|nr:hypothetical protein F5884DRAFT_708908 [Xylogone sp. PMI_703]
MSSYGRAPAPGSPGGDDAHDPSSIAHLVGAALVDDDDNEEQNQHGSISQDHDLSEGADPSLPPPYRENPATANSYPRDQKGGPPPGGAPSRSLHIATSSISSSVPPSDRYRLDSNATQTVPTYPVESEPMEEEEEEEAPPYEPRPSPPLPPPPQAHTHNQETEHTEAHVADDGRIEMRIEESQIVSDILTQALPASIDGEDASSVRSPSITTAVRGLGKMPAKKVIPLNIVMQVVGSRGDVQPFVALGQILKRYGHRVRLATHLIFRDFVTKNGLEFFSIGGDPVALMAFMVKNPSLVPGMDSFTSGDIFKRRKEMQEVLIGCWRSCIEGGDGTGPPLEDGYSGPAIEKPFIADAIIANPPSFAHIHCAEKMGIPLHIMFTMPWSPTLSFPHPLANIVSSTTGERRTNFVSYALVEALMWQGLGSVVNRFREKTLFLDPISDLSGPGIVSRLRVPHTYCWSPALIPKPRDWERHISISGFCFLPAESSYTPDSDLAAFLAEGPPPVYIGFGSIVVDDPDALTNLIFSAVEKVGQRALVSKGWGGLDMEDVPEGIFFVGNVPHDWLFKHVSCVVHHGGAGTTSTGISLGKPTVVVPFFGDQPFWGAMVAKAGAGPQPIPFKQLTPDNLAAGISTALAPETVEAAARLGQKIATENGRELAAEDFHDGVDLANLRCEFSPERKAIWRLSKTDIKLSAFAAAVLSNEGLLNFNDLKPYRPREYHVEQGSKEPITGGLGSILGTVGNLMLGMIDIPIDIAKAVAIKSPDQTQVPEIGQNSISSADSNNVPRSSFTGGQERPTHTPGTSVDHDQRDSSQYKFRSSDNDSLYSRSQPVRTQSDTSSVSARPAASRSTSEYAPSSSARDRDDSSSIGTYEMQQMTNVATNNSQTSPGKQKISRKDKVKGKLTAAKAFGFGFYKELSGNESMARSTFLKDVDGGSVQNHPAGSIGTDAALGAGKGLGRIASIGLKTPVEFTMGITNGFRNAPKLYGDDNIRPPQKVTDFNSGVAAATKELGYSVYDGVTGIFTQPVNGARKEGVTGFFKGLGKGLGGAVLKPGAGLFGIPGYTFKGVYREIQNHFGAGLQSHIIAIRTAEGFQDFQSSTEEQRLEVINKWQSSAMEKRRTKSGWVNSWMAVQKARKQWQQQSSKGEDEWQNQQPLTEEEPRPYQDYPESEAPSYSPAPAEPLPTTHTAQSSNIGNDTPTSAAGPSRPSPRSNPPSSSEFPPDYKNDSGYVPPPEKGARPNVSEAGTSSLPQPSEPDGDDEEGLRRALEASMRDDEESRRLEEDRRREEEIVMEYVKRQSLAEEQHRQSLLSRGTGTGSSTRS